MYVENEIIIGLNGNLTVCGSLAHKFYYANNFGIPQTLRNLDNHNQNTAWVYELDGTLRAAQSERANALHYMSDERILVSRERSQNES